MIHDSSYPLMLSRRAMPLAITFAFSLAQSCESFLSSPMPVGTSLRQPTGKNNIFKREFSPNSDERLHSNVVVIKKHEDFVDFLGADDRLCIVKFHASWCKSCQKFGVKYRKLAIDEGDRIDSAGHVSSGRVRFAEVEYTQNARLCKSLKVNKLPTVHMYRGGSGKLADMTCKPSKFQDVVDEMNQLLLPSIDTSSDLQAESEPTAGMYSSNEGIPFDEAMSAGLELTDEIMAEVTQEETNPSIERSEEKNTWFPF